MQVFVTRRLNDRHAVPARGIVCLTSLDAAVIGCLVCFVWLGLLPNTTHAAINVTGDVNQVHDGSDPWVLALNLKVGETGAGTLVIDAGSAVNGMNTYLGFMAGSTGAATVTGAGSSWTNSGNLATGYQGSGTLDILAGASVSNAAGLIFGTTGTATVDGNGSTWTNNGPLNVGIVHNFVFPDVPSSSTLNIQAGGAVTNSLAVIGDRASPTGAHTSAATVTGTGSSWTSSDDLYVGRNGGIGTLVIEDGGVVSNVNGYFDGLISNVTVTGSGSAWNNSGDLFLNGYASPYDLESDTTLSILNGASVTNQVGHIARNFRTSATVSVSGAGSAWVNHADLNVGDGGNGTLVIEDGGVVSSANGNIGRVGFIIPIVTVSAATVTGAGSAWNVAGSLAVGGQLYSAGGKGTLTVSDAGQVMVADTVKVWGSGTLQGDGAIVATTLSNVGVVSPGNSAGVLTLTGDYTQESAGKLVIELTGDGTQPGVDYDRLAVTGDIQLAGTLDVTMLDDVSLTPGNRYDIITFTGTRSGRFNFTLLPAAPGVGLGVEYGPNAVTIVAILPGDLNGDGFVGIQDLNAVLGNWNQNVPMWDLHAGDTNGDGYVGIEDLNAVLGNWNAGTPPMDVSAAIPEPGTIGVLAIGAAWGCFRGRGRGRMRRG